MGLKIEVGCRIQEILRVGHGMKIAWRDWVALILIGGEIDGEMRDLNSRCPFENLTKRDGDKDFESGGMAG